MIRLKNVMLARIQKTHHQLVSLIIQGVIFNNDYFVFATWSYALSVKSKLLGVDYWNPETVDE